MSHPSSFSAYKPTLLQHPDGYTQLVDDFLQRIESHKHLNAFIHTYPEEAKKRSIQIAQKIKLKKGGSLAGMIVGLKDVFCYTDHPISASSAILKGFISQITATSVERLLDQDALIIGHQNCDEFAMGASNEHSVYGNVSHPLDAHFSPGGSSGGSAASVAAHLSHVALGTDTGGSVRQPAAWCGIVGFKPTYGRISRYGVIEFASSIDTVGIFAHNIEDCAITLETIAGEDPYDNTSSSLPIPAYSKELSWKKKAKVAYLKDAIEHPSIDKDVRGNSLAMLKRIEELGHTLTSIDFPLLNYALPTYYCLTAAEASANLARYDGVRYGQRSSQAKSIEEVYTRTRTEMFGDEVKRRILLGTFVLSSGYYDDYYTRAQKVRRLLKDQLEALLDDYDFIVLPTTPTTAQRHGTSKDDPLKEYLSDLFTVLASMGGLPAISIPNGTNPTGWPIGFQVIGRAFGEVELLAFAKHLMENNSLSPSKRQ